MIFLTLVETRPVGWGSPQPSRGAQPGARFGGQRHQSRRDAGKRVDGVLLRPRMTSQVFACSGVDLERQIDLVIMDIEAGQRAGSGERPAVRTDDPASAAKTCSFVAMVLLLVSGNTN